MSASLFCRSLSLLAVVTLLGACGTDSTAPTVAVLEFSAPRLDLNTSRSGTVTLRNSGGEAIGPIDLLVTGITDAQSNDVSGVSAMLTPTRINSLGAGNSMPVNFTLTSVTVPPGSYEATVEARHQSERKAVLTVEFEVESVDQPDADVVRIQQLPLGFRQGDPVHLAADVRDVDGNAVTDPAVSWFVVPSTAGLMDQDGVFVPYTPGAARIILRSGSVGDTVDFSIDARGVEGSFTTVAQVPPPARGTTDLWVHDGFAYTGTLEVADGPTFVTGNTLYTWDVSNPNAPMLTDSLRIEARRLNDIKVRADGTLAVITHESSNDGRNGITLLDLSDRGHPQLLSRFTQGLESGIHNVWIKENFVFLVLDGTGNGLRILDVSNPEAPVVVSAYQAETSFLHDVYVRDGLAFLSYWNAGLHILDVGNGMAGGTTQVPTLVSQVFTAGGQTHNAWYWPSSGYVFVGEEDFGTPGILHVIDASDLTAPVEVATFAVSGQTPHNFWMDEEAKVLYAAWYGNGIRAIDMSGELRGRLELQGREVAGSLYGGSATFTWAPQLYEGLLYASDINLGLIVLEPPR